MSSHDAQPRHRKITKTLIRFLTTFCQVDPQEQQQILAYEEQRHPNADHWANLRAKSADKMNAPLWPRLVFWFYVFVNVHWCITMYWQYAYDMNYVRLEHLAEQKMSNSSAMNEMMEQYERRYNESHRMLALLGNPWREYHWGTNFALALLMLVTVFIYSYYIFIVHIFKIQEPYDSYFIRVTLSAGYETRKSRQLVRQCARQLQDSSKNFVFNALVRTEQCIQVVLSPVSGDIRVTSWPEPGQAKMRTTKRVQSISGTSEVHAQLMSHLFACDQLKQLCASGELIPVNRSVVWLDRASQQFATMAISNLVYSFIFDILVFCGYPIYLGVLHIETWADLLAFIELWILVEISVIATTCHMSLMNVNTTDQNNYMRWLVARVRRCIEHNDHLFAKCSGGEFELALKAINRNLMQTLMEYEVFLAQFKPIRRTLTPVVLAISIITLGCPVVTRLHMPYVIKTQRSLGIYFCAIVAIFTDTIMWPIIRLNTQSKILYARMMSLLGQTIEFNIALAARRTLLRARRASSGDSGVGQEISLCDQHLVWHLRGTLINSNKFVEQFTACVVSRHLQMTLPNLIKLHYWYLLLIISYYFRVESWSLIVGDFLDDPFGLLVTNHVH